MVRIYTETGTIFEGDASEYDRLKTKEKFKYAFSYVLPWWRILFFDSRSNHAYWLKKVRQRLQSFK